MGNARRNCRRVGLALALLLAMSVTRAAAAADEAATSGVIEDENTYNAERGLPPLVAPDPPRKLRVEEWYGWQILLADLGGVGCAMAGGSSACSLLYLFGGPGIHAAHGRPGLGGISFAGRILLPLIGAEIGHATASCPAPPPPAPPQDHGDSFVITFSGDWFPCGFERTVVGAAVGMLVAMGVDAAVGFTRPTAPTASEVSLSATPRRHLSLLLPELSLGAHDVTLGLRGAF